MKKLNKKGLIPENILIGLIIFGIIMTFGIMVFTSNANNYSDIIENNDTSKFSGIENQISPITGITGEIKSETIDGAVVGTDNFEQQLSVWTSLRFLWQSGNVAKNVSGTIVKEIAFGGSDDDDPRAGQFVSFVNNGFMVILGILILFALVAITMRFKASS